MGSVLMTLIGFCSDGLSDQQVAVDISLQVHIMKVFGHYWDLREVFPGQSVFVLDGTD